MPETQSAPRCMKAPASIRLLDLCQKPNARLLFFQMTIAEILEILLPGLIFSF
jgi:hypothetical protein